MLGLEEREKGEKLTFDQIKKLKELMTDSEMQINEISYKYWISYSVLIKIKNKAFEEIENLKTWKVNKIYGQKKEIIISLIKFYIQRYAHTTTAQEITNFVNQELQEDFDVNFIRKIMKTQVNLSFKDVKPRPSNIDMNRIKLIRKLFALKFAKIITNEMLVINIDESSINRGITANYSWGLKGVPVESKNSLFSDSISLVMAICSNGSWMSFLMEETINSVNFVWFIKIVHNWLISNSYFGYHEVLLLLDNWAFHKSITSTSILKTLGYTIAYLPAYSPDFAPIEMCFSILKRYLKESCKRENTKLSLRTNKIKIYNSLAKIKENTAKKLFGRLYHYINENI